MNPAKHYSILQPPTFSAFAAAACFILSGSIADARAQNHTGSSQQDMSAERYQSFTNEQTAPKARSTSTNRFNMRSQGSVEADSGARRGNHFFSDSKWMGRSMLPQVEQEFENESEADMYFSEEYAEEVTQPAPSTPTPTKNPVNNGKPLVLPIRP